MPAVPALGPAIPLRGGGQLHGAALAALAGGGRGPLERKHAVAWVQRGQVLDLVRHLGAHTAVVHRERQARQEAHQVVGGVLAAHAVVRAVAKHQVVAGKLDVLLALGAKAVGVERVRRLVALVARGPHRGDDHGALGRGVVVGEREVGLRGLRHHGRGGAEAQSLLDHLPRELHLVEHVAGDGRVGVGAQAALLLAHARQGIWVLGHQRQQPHQRRGGRVLGRKQEVHDRVGHLGVRGVEGRLHALLLRLPDLLQHLLRPKVQQALGLRARGHLGLGARGRLGEHLDDEQAALAALPHRGAGHAQREGQERVRHVHVRLAKRVALRGVVQVGARKHLL
mmetsp:Transcript_15667/g.39051  ORF Transcript_15667/g.39051 Transcript_15667/m.39051 type:complete len:339 (-) Transcript_15667:828-1844(-)